MRLAFSAPLLSVDSNIRGQAFATNASCSGESIECFQALSVEQVLQAQEKAADDFLIKYLLTTFLPWAPVIDGVQITGQVQQ